MFVQNHAGQLGINFLLSLVEESGVRLSINVVEIKVEQLTDNLKMQKLIEICW